MKIYKKEGDNLVITVPLKGFRFNPYDESEGPMDNIIGVYENEYDNGLAYRIDMSYKAKPDQWSDYFFKLDGTLEEFREMCKEIGVDYVNTSPYDYKLE